MAGSLVKFGPPSIPSTEKRPFFDSSLITMQPAAPPPMTMISASNSFPDIPHRYGGKGLMPKSWTVAVIKMRTIDLSFIGVSSTVHYQYQNGCCQEINSAGWGSGLQICIINWSNSVFLYI